MTCNPCKTGEYNMQCINCMANWILQLDKPLRKRSIEMQGWHDVDELKALIMRKAGI